MPYAFCLYYYYCYFFFPFFFCILSSTTTNPPRKTIILYFLLYSTSVLLLLPFPTNRDLLEILYERFTILCDIYFYYHYYLLAIFLLAPFLFFFFFFTITSFSLSLSLDDKPRISTRIIIVARLVAILIQKIIFYFHRANVACLHGREVRSEKFENG